MRELNLDGGERSIIKAIGFGGSGVTGGDLFERCPGFEEAEFIDTLKGLVTMGYVDADSESMRTLEDIREERFQISSGYSRELRDAMNPSQKPKKSRRVRRE